METGELPTRTPLAMLTLMHHWLVFHQEKVSRVMPISRVR
jgi:hypothetical protein